ncbi:MAG: tRNA dihydrouridine(16) synthase DusC, partial [Giesbergeria sp.]
HEVGSTPTQLPWSALVPHLLEFWELVCAQLEPRQRAGRLKQWLNLLRRRYPEAQQAYDTVRVLTEQTAVGAALVHMADVARK